MTSREAMRYCYDAVTMNAAKVMGLDGYGLEVGCNGDLVVLQAADPIEAIRLKARRLFVVRRGKVIAEGARQVTQIDLPGRTAGRSGELCAQGRRKLACHPGRPGLRGEPGSMHHP
jgi:cytosine deaminase